jgi:uncharacterized protein YegL
MKTDLARVVVILDRSGSMQSMRVAAISGFNEFIGKLKAQPGDVNVKLVQFDDFYEVVFDLPLAQVPDLTDAMFVPRGMTALLDAQGKTIVALGEELSKMPQADRPASVTVLMITDGLENASKEYKQAQIKAMVTEQREKYSWNFVYVGANQDAIAVAASVGIPMASAINLDGGSLSNQAVYASMAQYVNTSRSLGAMGQATQDVAFSVDDRKRALTKDPVPARR